MAAVEENPTKVERPLKVNHHATMRRKTQCLVLLILAVSLAVHPPDVEDERRGLRSCP